MARIACYYLCTGVWIPYSIHFAPTVVSKSLCWRWTLHCTNESLPLLPQQLDILHTTLQPGMDERQVQTFPEV